MKLIIFGSRDAYPSFEVVDTAVSRLLDVSHQFFNHAIDEVVCGTARGGDRCGEEWALHNSIPVKYFPANWERDGKRAGFIRNKEMAEYATAGIGFWKNESSGTANMVAQLVRLSKRVLVV